MYQTQKGFTLIELLIVITIAAVMAVIALPNMNQWIASRRAASQAEQIANLLRFARNEAVRLNLPVYICPVKIKSDGSHNGCIHKKNSTSIGMLAYANQNKKPSYRNDGVDLSIRYIILNGDTEKVEYSFDYIPIGTSRSAFSSSASEVRWKFLPNGTFEYLIDDKDDENYQFSDGHIKISLTDKSAADAETKKARATVLLINGNGHVEICAKNDERKMCEYSSQ